MSPVTSRRQSSGSVVTHYVALAAGFVVILWIGRNQWFFGDDWAILAPHLDAAIMSPHMGHWNLVPAVVFQGVRDWLGLGSYLPFLALAVLANLAVAHLSWRILRRCGAEAWVSTLLSILVVFLGAGAENILWAFQFGFMGAVALGLGVLLVLARSRLTPAGCAAVVVLSILAPMFSGTAIPVLAAAAIVGWVRHGFLRTLALLIPAAAGYLVWFFAVALDHRAPAEGAASVGSMVLYAGGMYAGGLGRALPWIGLGVLAAVALVLWFAVTVRARMRSVATPAYALALGSLVFFALTTWSRASLGLGGSAAQRYAWVTVVLLVPAFGLMFSGLAARSRAWWLVTVVVISVLVVFNAATLYAAADAQAQREAGSRARVATSLDRILQHPDDATLLAQPADAAWAPDLLGSDLLRLYDNAGLRP